MKLPRDLSGAELIKLLCKHFGYRRVNPLVPKLRVWECQYRGGSCAPR